MYGDVLGPLCLRAFPSPHLQNKVSSHIQHVYLALLTKIRRFPSNKLSYSSCESTSELSSKTGELAENMDKIPAKINALPPDANYFSLEFFPPKTEIVST